MEINSEALSLLPPPLHLFVRELFACSWVEAIVLGGSRAGTAFDHNSDFDLYVYTSSEPSLSDRKRAAALAFSYVELDNRYWEPEDDAVLKVSEGWPALPVDIIYRNLVMTAQGIDRLINDFQVSVGYSTCILHNIQNSVILCDRGAFTKLQGFARNAHMTKGLIKAIIDKNLPLLNRALPNYRDQILKAVRRNDLISVNHRTAAWLASYFDIVISAAELTHPGEKRMLDYLLTRTTDLPEYLAEDVQALLRASSQYPDELAQILNQLHESLLVWLKTKGFPV